MSDTGSSSLSSNNELDDPGRDPKGLNPPRNPFGGGADQDSGQGRPEGTRPEVRMTAGTRYAWTLSSARGTIAEAQFETLPAEAMRRVERARAAARTFSERVVHALLLQELGAELDSREAWAALARERPEMPQLSGLAR